MEDSLVILGDIDGWLEAFERGDFCAEWDKQQQAMHARCEASYAQNDGAYCDASLD